MSHRILSDFVTLWTTVDPIGTVPIFLSVVGTRPAAEARRIATRAIVISAIILVVFMAAGQAITEALGISIQSFQIAGGIVLFLIALSMIFEDPRNPDGPEAATARAQDPAVFPLAIPAIAGPGTMLACVVLTDNNRYSVGQQVSTGAVLLGVLGIQWALLVLATRIQKVLGIAGTSVLSRVMGLLLSALAVQIVFQAILQVVKGSAAG